MIAAEHVRPLVERHLEGTPQFIVDVEVRSGNKVLIEVDAPGSVTIEELARLNRAVRDEIDALGEDVELQVSSPGAGRPFKVPQQFNKYQGRLVRVELTDGRTLEGILDGKDADSLRIRVQHPSKIKGRLPKLDEEPTVLPFSDIRSTQASIQFN